MEVRIELPEKLQEYLKKPIDNQFIIESLTVELYREGAITLRQAAELLKTDLYGILKVLERRKTFINYDEEELANDCLIRTSKRH